MRHSFTILLAFAIALQAAALPTSNPHADALAIRHTLPAPMKRQEQSSALNSWGWQDEESNNTSNDGSSNGVEYQGSAPDEYQGSAPDGGDNNGSDNGGNNNGWDNDSGDQNNGSGNGSSNNDDSGDQTSGWDNGGNNDGWDNGSDGNVPTSTSTDWDEGSGN